MYMCMTCRSYMHVIVFTQIQKQVNYQSNPEPVVKALATGLKP